MKIRAPKSQPNDPAGARAGGKGRLITPFLAALIAAVAFCVPGWNAAVAEDRAEPAPEELKGIGITEHLNDRLPLDLTFANEDGDTVRLGNYFQKGRPVILNLVYFTCPMLCTLVLNGVVEGMQGLSWELGKDYENVTVSIDPSETPALAKAKQKTYLEQYGHPEAAAGWHFLTGKQENITALAQTVGFNYRYNPETREFIHTAGTFLCTPDGRLARYLYGIQYEQQTFRLGMLEASEGKIGNTLDKLVLYCYHYDSNSGRYALAATNVMRVGGVATAGILGVVLVGLFVRDRRRRATTSSKGAQS